MKAELWYSVVVRDSQGKFISRECRKSRSFLRQWNDIIWAQVTGASGYIKRIDGNETWGIAPISENLLMTSVGGVEANQSIVVGSDNTPVTISDYALKTQIAHGSGAGQLNHQAATVNESVVSGPNCGFVVERAFVNNSGGDVTVRESAIYVRMKGPVYYGYACVVRDVLTMPQTIPNGGSLSMSYTLRVTV
ncbi:MAG: hypothetical protein HY530_02050 [Chloroflexi bacterium]|nr:hypothetical protein [Chloroflexota bacterium]